MTVTFEIDFATHGIATEEKFVTPKKLEEMLTSWTFTLDFLE